VVCPLFFVAEKAEMRVLAPAEIAIEANTLGHSVPTLADGLSGDLIDVRRTRQSQRRTNASLRRRSNRARLRQINARHLIPWRRKSILTPILLLGMFAHGRCHAASGDAVDRERQR
jgi:hypothetical protein